MERVEAHLTAFVEVVDAQVGHDHGGSASVPALIASPARRIGAGARVAGRGTEIDPLDEAACTLAHDHKDLTCVDRNLARAAPPGQPRRGALVIGTHDCAFDVSKTFDLP